MSTQVVASQVRGYLGNHTMLHGYKVNELNKPVAQQGDGASSYISSLCEPPAHLDPHYNVLAYRSPFFYFSSVVAIVFKERAAVLSQGIMTAPVGD